MIIWRIVARIRNIGSLDCLVDTAPVELPPPKLNHRSLPTTDTGLQQHEERHRRRKGSGFECFGPLQVLKVFW